MIEFIPTNEGVFVPASEIVEMQHVLRGYKLNNDEKQQDLCCE